MKSINPAIIFLLFSFFSIFTGCSEEPKLELFNPQAFAYAMDNGWEVNASVNAKGFAQVKDVNTELYHLSLNYKVNLYSSEDTVFNADYDSVTDSVVERTTDIQIETQLQLDSGFSKGNYSLEFIVEDEYSHTKDTLVTKFILD
jgi:hypothetical protein